MCQLHARTLSLQHPIPYLHVLFHSVTVGAVNTMLFIGTPFDLTYWRNLIQIWISSLCQYSTCCGLHSFPLFIKWCIILRKYCTGGIICEAWFSLPIQDYILCFIFVEVRDSLVSFIQTASFSLVNVTRNDSVWM